MNKKILITGGSGFIGSRLVEELLLNKNYYIVVIDTMWFGCNLPHKNLKVIREDIRNIEKFLLKE